MFSLKKSPKIKQGNYIIFAGDDRNWYSGKVYKIYSAKENLLDLDVIITDNRLIPKIETDELKEFIGPREFRLLVLDSRENIYPVEESVLIGEKSLNNVRRMLRAVEPRLLYTQVDNVMEQLEAIIANYTGHRIKNKS